MKYIYNRSLYKTINEAIPSEQLYDGTWEDTYIGKLFSFLGNSAKTELKKGKINNLVKKLNNILDNMQSVKLAKEGSFLDQMLLTEVNRFIDFLNNSNSFDKDSILDILEDILNNIDNIKENINTNEDEYEYNLFRSHFEELYNFVNDELFKTNESLSTLLLEAITNTDYAQIGDIIADYYFKPIAKITNDPNLSSDDVSLSSLTLTSNKSGYDKYVNSIKSVFKMLSKDLNEVINMEENDLLKSQTSKLIDKLQNLPYGDYKSFSTIFEKELKVLLDNIIETAEQDLIDVEASEQEALKKDEEYKKDVIDQINNTPGIHLLVNKKDGSLGYIKTDLISIEDISNNWNNIERYIINIKDGSHKIRLKKDLDINDYDIIISEDNKVTNAPVVYLDGSKYPNNVSNLTIIDKNDNKYPVSKYDEIEDIEDVIIIDDKGNEYDEIEIEPSGVNYKNIKDRLTNKFKELFGSLLVADDNSINEYYSGNKIKLKPEIKSKLKMTDETANKANDILKSETNIENEKEYVHDILKIFNRAFDTYTITKEDYDDFVPRWGEKRGRRKKAIYKPVGDWAYHRRLFRKWKDEVLSLLNQYSEYLTKDTKEFMSDAINYNDFNKSLDSRMKKLYGIQSKLSSAKKDKPSKKKVNNTRSTNLYYDEISKFEINNKNNRKSLAFKYFDKNNSERKMITYVSDIIDGSGMEIRFTVDGSSGFLSNYLNDVRNIKSENTNNETSVYKGFIEEIYEIKEGSPSDPSRYIITDIYRTKDNKKVKDMEVQILDLFILKGDDNNDFIFPKITSNIKDNINSSEYDQI